MFQEVLQESESVFNALAAVDQTVEIVAVHDAARPWVTKNHFEDLLAQLDNDESAQGVSSNSSNGFAANEKGKIIPVDRKNFLRSNSSNFLS